MERRSMEPERLRAVRLSVAVSQTLAQADEERVTYWMEQYASAVEREWLAPDAQRTRPRQGGARIHEHEPPDLTEEKISAAG
jgi:hypothetical protein